MKVRLWNTHTDYGVVGWTLHWASVAGLLYLIILAATFEPMSNGQQKSDLISLHNSVGLAFLALMIARLVWRNMNPNPVQSYEISRWQKLAAKTVHWTIYATLILQCVLGAAILQFSGKPFPIFNIVEISPILEKDEAFEELVLYLHTSISDLLYPLLALHIAAAIYHQIFGVRDI